MDIENLSEQEKAKLAACVDPDAIQAKTYASPEAEQTILSAMLRVPEFIGQAASLVKAKYFANEVREAICSYALDYYSRYQAAPSRRWLEEQAAIRWRKPMEIFRAELNTVLTVETELHERKALLDRMADFAWQQDLRLRVNKIVDLVFSTDPDRKKKIHEIMFAPMTAHQGEKVRSYSAVEFLKYPPAKFLIRQHLIEGCLGLLYGKSGIGKSFLALAMAFAVATGRSLFSRYPAQKRNVLYLVSEAAGCFPVRLAAYFQHHALRAEEVPNIRFLPAAYNFQEAQETIQGITATLPADWKPQMIVIDTLACNIHGSENAPEDMLGFVNTCQAIRDAFGGASVLIVHHEGKNAGLGARGHTSLTAACQAVIQVDGESDGDILYVKSEKLTNGKPFSGYSLDKRPIDLETPLDDDNKRALVLTWRGEEIPHANKLDQLARMFTDDPAKAWTAEGFWDGAKGAIQALGWNSLNSLKNAITEATKAGLLATAGKEGKASLYYRPRVKP